MDVHRQEQHTAPCVADLEAYTQKEARRRLNVGHTKFWEMKKAGLIRTVRIGGRDKVTSQEIRRIMQEGA